MAVLRIERKVAAMNREDPNDHSSKNQAQNTKSPRVQEDCITQVSDDFEGRVKKKLS